MPACGRICPFCGINWKERHWRHDLFLVAGQTVLRTADHGGQGLSAYSEPLAWARVPVYTFLLPVLHRCIATARLYNRHMADSETAGALSTLVRGRL